MGHFPYATCSGTWFSVDAEDTRCFGQGRAHDAGPGECRTGRCPSKKGRRKTANELAQEGVQEKQRRKAEALRRAEAQIEGGGDLELEGLWDEDDGGEGSSLHQEL
eukprot:1161024-Pelagomonas_calceolata.AAC.16